ncbi:prostaglandin reductase 1-like [Schistocerca americana]|uniref:prostaglandin reductase 1-like n=1 Tax=Schistocerca americana TaxID=7009 RepID=UPI001F4F486B|nr:prostaglandin reductase 1-like [Schistocerca americana]
MSEPTNDDDEKVKWLKEELGFHHAFNYKTNDATEALKQAAPDGIDVYFDNVGGELSSAVINTMREWGRISVCGSISGYNESNLPKATIIQPAAIFKQLRMEGFLYSRWHDRWDEGITQLTQWVREGKIKYRETVTEGFQNTPKAFAGMLQGDNLGKAVVKV